MAGSYTVDFKISGLSEANSLISQINLKLDSLFKAIQRIKGAVSSFRAPYISTPTSFYAETAGEGGKSGASSSKFLGSSYLIGTIGKNLDNAVGNMAGGGLKSGSFLNLLKGISGRGMHNLIKNTKIPFVKFNPRTIASFSEVMEPLALTIGVIIIALTTFAGILGKAAKEVYSAGTNLGNTNKLLGLGFVYGSQTANANSFNDFLIKNPYSRIVAQNAGISPNYIGAYGDMDNSGRYLKAIQLLDSMSNEDAIRFAGNGPLSSLLWIKQLDSINKGEIMASLSLSPMTRSNEKSGVNLQFAAKQTWQLILNTLIEIGNAVAPILVRLLELINGILIVIDWVVAFFSRLIKIFTGGIFGSGFKDQADDLTGLFKGTAEDKIKRDAIKDHNMAMIDHTRALNNTVQTFGGGINTKRAVPPSWNNINIQIAHQDQRLQLGQLT